MFSSRHGLNNHKRKVDENPGTCNICNKSFSSAVKVAGHKKIMYIGGKAFLCTTCGHQSRDPSNLKKHMMIHSKVVKRSPRKKHV
jgi:transcription elongation factor Elf1